MNRDETQLAIRYGAIILLIVGATGWWVRWRNGDVEWCRGALRGLASGSPTVEDRLDWERLAALGLNVGAAYRQQATEQERAEYKHAFIQSFSNGFHQNGARASHFVRWRVQQRTDQQVIVAADYPKQRKTLLFVMPASGRKRIEAIRWADDPGRG